jgi:hypothetical protein
VGDLPELLEPLHQAETDAYLGVRCRRCGRAWNIPGDGFISEAAFSYLVEHALTHRRMPRRRLPGSASQSNTRQNERPEHGS